MSCYLWIMINFCKVCNKKVLFHSFQLKCSLCLKCVHSGCLPHINRDDSVYQNRSSNSWLCIECCKETFPFNNTDDDGEFLDFISETWLCKIYISLKALGNKLFCPFNFNNDKDVLYLNIIDPDLHYFPFNFIQFLIVNTTRLTNELIKTKWPRIPSLFSIWTFEAYQLLLKFQSYIKTLNLSFSIIGLTETLFNSSISNLYTIKGYKSINNSRTNKKEGGVALFVNKK